MWINFDTANLRHSLQVDVAEIRIVLAEKDTRDSVLKNSSIVDVVG